MLTAGEGVHAVPSLDGRFGLHFALLLVEKHAAVGAELRYRRSPGRTACELPAAHWALHPFADPNADCDEGRPA